MRRRPRRIEDAVSGRPGDRSARNHDHARAGVAAADRRAFAASSKRTRKGRSRRKSAAVLVWSNARMHVGVLDRPQPGGGERLGHVRSRATSARGAGAAPCISGAAAHLPRAAPRGRDRRRARRPVIALAAGAVARDSWPPRCRRRAAGRAAAGHAGRAGASRVQNDLGRLALFQQRHPLVDLARGGCG